MTLYFKDILPQSVELGRRIVERLLAQSRLSTLDKDSQLWHHGIKGQKWGERNGPPYPLDESARSPEERRAANSKPHVARDILKQKSSSLKKGIRKLRAQIAEHEAKIKEPEKFYPEWEKFRDQEKAGFVIHWKKEIKTFQKDIDTRIDELKKRGDYNDE